MFYTMSNLSIQVQGLSSTKIVGGGRGAGDGARSWKNVGHHGRPTEKFKVLKCLKPLKWLLNFFAISGTFLNMFRTFLLCQNNFCEPFSFYKGFFIEA